VTVDLAGTTAVPVRRVQFSAMLRPPIAGDADADGQNRFGALRRFEVLACEAITADCTQDGSYRSIHVTPRDAFLSGCRGRRQLTIRSFAVPQTAATHLRPRVLTSQCSGGPA
jgi:extracellular elastinolytic metalloproteinase